MLAAAKRPTLYVGVGLRRHGLTELVVRLAEHLRLPLATDVLGNPQFPRAIHSSPESTWACWVTRPCGRCSTARTASSSSASSAPILEPASGPSASTRSRGS